MTDQKRILILGTSAYRQQTQDALVVSKRWDQIDAGVNVRDHDVLVIDLLGISNPEEVDWRGFMRQVTRRAVLELLVSGGRLMVLGDPRFTVEIELKETPLRPMSVPRREFLHWSGIEFQWDGATGTSGGPTVDLAGLPPAFRSYLNSISRWSYSLARANVAMPDFGNIDTVRSLGVDIRPLWANRYDHAVVFEADLMMMESGKTLGRLGPLVFMPRSGATREESIEAALALVGIELTTPEPEWVTGLTAPDQRGVDLLIAEVQQRADEVAAELDAAHADKAARRRWLGLLYEKQSALEPLVRDALRELGAEVEDPSDGDREDGWITVRAHGETFEGVLEIKSTRSATFDEQGLRQLEEWKLNGEQSRSKDYKGVFIGNRDIGRPITDRQAPFSDGWTRSAAKRQNVGVLTEILYVALVLKSEGVLNVGDLWVDVFRCDGPLDGAPYIRKFAAAMPDDAVQLFGSSVVS
jgi:hypothetical protein